jgi:predicted nucleic acid-binding protein
VLVDAAFEVLEKGPWRRVNTWPDWELVKSLSDKRGVRGADLWHLAVAKTLMKGFPELTLLTYDNHLKKAAKAECLLI